MTDLEAEKLDRILGNQMHIMLQLEYILRALYKNGQVPLMGDTYENVTEAVKLMQR